MFDTLLDSDGDDLADLPFMGFIPICADAGGDMTVNGAAGGGANNFPLVRFRAFSQIVLSNVLNC
jgi:hypothetical protein